MLIDTGGVTIDGMAVYINCLVNDASEIRVNGLVVRPGKQLVYLKFYKPPGYESTLNSAVPNNLSGFFKEHRGLAIAGRLDKRSEGLLLLSNNGQWVESLCNPAFEKEKEYRVTLDEAPDDVFFEAFRSGVFIGNYVTKPCMCEPFPGGTSINVILTEGKNRQIRRMCAALGYQVLALKRVRIDTLVLGRLTPGESETFIPQIYNNLTHKML